MAVRAASASSSACVSCLWSARLYARFPLVSSSTLLSARACSTFSFVELRTLIVRSGRILGFFGGFGEDGPDAAVFFLTGAFFDPGGFSTFLFVPSKSVLSSSSSTSSSSSSWSSESLKS